ncbi:hypothetical protein [Nitrosomonas sp.]|uniref:hypothetical protein n=1 Tax=Nitrosomonas sp. TaxID=42353 RepID=UPI001D681BB1|nr:hypothetical protein [Nitrosomonas sp.]MBX3616541.1 hypothetical protein [Nitrosomonas sp.]
MTTTKVFIYSMMSMLVTFLALYINTKSAQFSSSFTLSDDAWIGIALFIIYLLLAILYPSKSPYRLLPFKLKSSGKI